MRNDNKIKKTWNNNLCVFRYTFLTLTYKINQVPNKPSTMTDFTIFCLQ